MGDLIDRQAAIDVLSLGKEILSRVLDDTDVVGAEREKYSWGLRLIESNIEDIKELPSAQPEISCSETPNTSDTISRQAAISRAVEFRLFDRPVKMVAVSELEALPSAQPERTCVNCGRTANNGGWYADGGTRCPIEEHYALPKDGYCHLWEKRNVTDDDYTERREE